jgi:hypothetical protein
MAAVDERTVAALAALIELEIPSQYAAGVAENLDRLLLQAKLVMDLELPPDTEPAPVFLP